MWKNLRVQSVAALSTDLQTRIVTVLTAPTHAHNLEHPNPQTSMNWLRRDPDRLRSLRP